MTKQYLVTIETEKLQASAPDEKVSQLEAVFVNIVEEINMSNGQAQLRVTSVEEQT